jgi:uncharacterized protein YsxB (DUF464 family)
LIEIYFKNIRFDDELFLDAASGEIEFWIKGHAELGIKGNDIVCAAVSALVQTSVIAIERVARIRQRIKQEEGFLRSVIDIKHVNAGRLEALRIILTTMILGLEEIIRAYPERVKIYYS